MCVSHYCKGDSMAKLSLRQIVQSQLSRTPIIPGQLVCCEDTGNFYKDGNGTRKLLSSDIIFVDSLPLAPIADKIYLVKPNKLYIYNSDDSDWVCLNQTVELPDVIIQKNSSLEFPSVGKENCIYIDREKNKTYRWSDTDTKYYCVGSDYDDIKLINGGSSSSFE